MGTGARLARVALVLAAFAFRPGLPAWAEGGSAPDAAAKSFVVGIAAFESASSGTGQSLFLSALPRLIVAELDPLPPRHEGKKYRDERLFREGNLSLFGLGAELARCLDDLALRSLEPGVDPYKRSQAVAEAARKADEARAKLDKASGSAGPGGSAAGSDARATVASLSTANLAGDLVSPGEAGLAAAAKQGGLDLLVTGRVEALGDYLSVVVSGWDAALGKEVFSWKEYGSADDPGPLARLIADRIAGEIAGAPFARLDLAASPESARILVDGKEAEPGVRSLFFFAPAKVRVSALASGRAPAETEVSIVPGERKEVSFALEDSSVASILVSTKPPALPVFINGLPAGASPVEARIGEGRSVISAYGGDGARDRAIVSSGDRGRNGSLPEVILEPKGGGEDAATALVAAKRSFYDALGWFVLSLPPLSVAWGMANTWSEVAGTSTGTTVAGLRDSAYTTTSILGAGTLALAVNAVLRFTRYIKAAR